MRNTRTTIRLDENLARQAREYADQRGSTFTDVVSEALDAWIHRPTPKRPHKRFKLPTSGTKGSKGFTDEEYRAVIQRIYDEEAEKIFKNAFPK